MRRRHRPRRPGRPRDPRAGDCSSTSARPGSARSSERGRRRADRRDGDARRARRRAARRAVRRGSRRRPASAASPLLRNVGTVGGNLCQHTRCWYYRGAEWHCWLGGGETCYAQIGDHRKHGLEPGDCISAHPSDLAPALAACGATVELRSRSGARELPLLELYRRPTADNRSLVVLEPGELVVAVRLPAPPDASAYQRLGERAAFSFPLVSVAAARRGGDVRLVAAGVANIPRELDPADPLGGPAGEPAVRLEAPRARDARRAQPRRGRLRATVPPGRVVTQAAVVTASTVARWTSRNAPRCARLRPVSSSVCRRELPEVAGRDEQLADLVRLGPVAVRPLVAGIEGEPDHAVGVGRMPHPDHRRRHRQVLVDPEERHRARQLRGAVRRRGRDRLEAVGDPCRGVVEHGSQPALVEPDARAVRTAISNELGWRPYG